MSVQSQSPLSQSGALDQIWRAYADDKSLVHRNELIMAYQSVVNEAVRRLPSYVLAYWGADELRSFGQDGLVRAITRWSDSDNSKFEQYALRCIRGAIFDELRRLDWMPRSIRRRVVSYRATFDSLLGELGRTPRPEEVLAAMGLKGRQAMAVMREVDGSQLLHLEGQPNSRFHEDGALVDVIANKGTEPEAELLASADVEALHEAMTKLGEREHTVVFLAFVGGLTQEQIGQIIGVGGPQVCKIQSNALLKLRTMLSPIREGADRALVG